MRHRFSQVLEWIGSHELAVIVALLAVIGGAWIFIEVAGEVVEGDTQKFDERLVLALRDPADSHNPIGPPWMSEVGRDFTALGGYAVLILVTTSVLIFLWLDRRYYAMAFVTVATFGGFLLTFALKNIFDRPRPELVPHLSHVSSASFPSGHSMMSAAVFLTLGALLARFVQERMLKAYFLVVATLLTFMVGLSRIYLGVHYPTDVLAGWSAGLAWALACWMVARRLQKRGAVPPELDRAVPPEE